MNLEKYFQDKPHKRGLLEFYYDILIKCIEEKLPTVLMNEANLGFQNTMLYLYQLEKMGYIETIPVKRGRSEYIIKTTNEGKKAIKNINSLYKILRIKRINRRGYTTGVTWDKHRGIEGFPSNSAKEG